MLEQRIKKPYLQNSSIGNWVEYIDAKLEILKETRLNKKKFSTKLHLGLNKQVQNSFPRESLNKTD